MSAFMRTAAIIASATGDGTPSRTRSVAVWPILRKAKTPKPPP